MTREQAKEIAREAIRRKPQSYYVEPFEPHEWVVDAILEAYSQRKTILRKLWRLGEA